MINKDGLSELSILGKCWKIFTGISENNSFQAGNYMFKVNNRNTRTRCEWCSKITIKKPERCHCFSADIAQVLTTASTLSHAVFEKAYRGSKENYRPVSI